MSKEVVAALVGIGLNLVAALIGFFSRGALDFVRSRRGEVSGIWVARHLSAGEVEKLDLVTVRHRGERLSGTIRRKRPTQEGKKKWHFTGVIREGRAVGYYWPSRRQHQTGGFGVFLMKKGGPIFEGHYFQSRTEFVATDEGVEAFDREGYKRFRLRWERVDRPSLWWRILHPKRYDYLDDLPPLTPVGPAPGQPTTKSDKAR